MICNNIENWTCITIFFILSSFMIYTCFSYFSGKIPSKNETRRYLSKMPWKNAQIFIYIMEICLFAHCATQRVFKMQFLKFQVFLRSG